MTISVNATILFRPLFLKINHVDRRERGKMAARSVLIPHTRLIGEPANQTNSGRPPSNGQKKCKKKKSRTGGRGDNLKQENLDSAGGLYHLSFFDPAQISLFLTLSFLSFSFPLTKSQISTHHGRGKAPRR